MTTTYTPAPFPTVADVAPSAPAVATSRPLAPSGRWPLWGAAAGLLGVVATLATDPQAAIYEEGVTLHQDALDLVERSGYHIGVVAGLAATLCVLITAAGWKRWASERVPDSLAGRLVPMALTASAGAMILGYGMKGALAVYLPGGMDAGFYGNDGLFSIFMFLDFAPYVAWWGVCFAAMAMTFLSLRERALPRWVGYLSIPFVVAPVALLVTTGLPGFPGVVDGVWLAIVSIGTALGARRAAAR